MFNIYHETHELFNCKLILFILCLRSDDEDDTDETIVPITSFFSQNNEQVNQKTPFFDDRGFIVTTSL